MGEEVYCYHCKKTFYLKTFRLQEAKSVSCIFCGKRIDKSKLICPICKGIFSRDKDHICTCHKLKTNGGAIPPITKVMGILAIFL